MADRIGHQELTLVVQGRRSLGPTMVATGHHERLGFFHTQQFNSWLQTPVLILSAMFNWFDISWTDGGSISLKLKKLSAAQLGLIFSTWALDACSNASLLLNRINNLLMASPVWSSNNIYFFKKHTFRKNFLTEKVLRTHQHSLPYNNTMQKFNLGPVHDPCFPWFWRPQQPPGHSSHHTLHSQSRIDYISKWKLPKNPLIPFLKMKQKFWVISWRCWDVVMSHEVWNLRKKCHRWEWCFRCMRRGKVYCEPP